MTSIAQLRRSLEAISKRAQPPQGPRRKLTTAENRQEFERILAKLESLPADAPSFPRTPAEAAREREILAELDRILATMNRLGPS